MTDFVLSNSDSARWMSGSPNLAGFGPNSRRCSRPERPNTRPFGSHWWSGNRVGAHGPARLEEVRRRLEELERRRILADERVTAARARIESIRFEREGLETRRESLLAELSEAGEAAAGAIADLERLQSEEADLAGSVEKSRQRRADVEREESTAREDLAGLLAEIGSTGAAGEALRERNRERRRELERRLTERVGADESVVALTADLAGQQKAAAESEASRGVLEDRLGKQRVAERESRERSGELRDRITSLEGELATVTARAGALSSLLSSGRDLPAVVSRLLEDPNASAGVHGVLAEFLTVPGTAAAAVESLPWTSASRGRGRELGLGAPNPRLAGDTEGWRGARSSAARSGSTFRRPDRRGAVDLIEVRGAGAIWARSLLAGVSSGDQEFSPSDTAWVAPDGSGQDARGAVRLGQPSSGKGVLRQEDGAGRAGGTPGGAGRRDR